MRKSVLRPPKSQLRITGMDFWQIPGGTGMKRSHRIGLLAGLIVLVAATVVAAALYLSMKAQPDQQLWTAQAAVESRGNPRAYCRRDGSSGIVQIRTDCLNDINRIAKARGLKVRFKPSDRFDPVKARRMWQLYLEYYAAKYEHDTGRPCTYEVLARIWNGGPCGWKKASTVNYWGRVRSRMD